MSTSRSQGPAARVAARLATALVLVLVGLPLSARAALGQEHLVWSSPGEGAVMDVPAMVSLRFSRTVVIGSALITVGTPDASTLPPAIERVRGTRVDRALPAGLAPGPYRVAWTVSVDDGHELSGTSTFVVPAGARAPAPPDRVPASARDGADDLEPVAIVGWLACTAGLILVAVSSSRRRSDH